MKYTEFHENKFRHSVNEAMQSVDRILRTDRHPRLAGDVDHTYHNKYDLANLFTNTSVIALVNVLERMGLDAEALKAVAAEAKSSERTATLRFQASDKCEFLMQQKVEVPSTRSVETTETMESTSSIFGSSKKSTISRVVHHVNEFHWKVTTSWSVSVYTGVFDGDSARVIQERSSSTQIVTQTRADQPPIPSSTTHDPIEVSLSWILDQIDESSMSAKFSIDVEDDKSTRTPRQNQQIEEALRFWSKFAEWSKLCEFHFKRRIQNAILSSHNPAIPSSQNNEKKLDDVTTQALFIPIQPLMDDTVGSPNDEEGEPVQGKSLLKLTPPSEDEGNSSDDSKSPLLSSSDLYKLLNEHVRSLDQKMSTISKHFPAKQLVKLVSVSEASFVMLCRHSKELNRHYVSCVGYIEEMLKQQLRAAIGKEVKATDLDKFMKHHNAKLLRVPPRPFCHAIRRPNHYPDGVLSIETVGGDKEDENTPIETLVREVEAPQPLRVPLNAAVELKLTGSRFLHGWMQHRFEYSHNSYQLVARARQFSSFVLLVGQLAGPNIINPKDAIILQNKDELIIPLLLEELPSAKEFKDAIQSLSPEQQRFAKSFRSMQLESSVLGVCIIQIKPQLEALLGIPNDSLTKEMKLTQDLTSLFVDYQVPSDLLSYDGPTGGQTGDSDGELVGAISVKEKVANVKGHVQAVLDVVESEKKKQLEDQAMKANMAANQHRQQNPSKYDGFHTSSSGSFSGYGAPPPSGGLFGASPSGGLYGAPAPAMALAPAMACSIPESAIKTRSAMMKKSFASSAAPPPSHHVDMQAESCAVDEEDFCDDDMNFDGCESFKGGADPQRQDSDKDNKATDSKGNGDVGSTDFTLIPKVLDRVMGVHDTDNALRSTIIKTTDDWERSRHENLLSKAKRARLGEESVRSEKNKAFDLLDALSRSGSLPIACSELHVVISVTHGFENDVMGTVIQDNINPIEKLEKSTLLLASTIYGVPPQELVNGQTTLARLKGAFPALLGADGENDNQTADAATNA